MSSTLANVKLRPFLVIENDHTIQWMQEVVLPDGTRDIRPASNDKIYDDLELRYGPGFAQWVIDGLNKKSGGQS